MKNVQKQCANKKQMSIYLEHLNGGIPAIPGIKPENRHDFLKTFLFKIFFIKIFKFQMLPPVRMQMQQNSHFKITAIQFSNEKTMEEKTRGGGRSFFPVFYLRRAEVGGPPYSLCGKNAETARKQSLRM